jgi:hypothetical protein
MEKGIIFEVWHRVGGNKPMAAHLLGLGVKTRYCRLVEYRYPKG